jgi:hypothetical protein
MMMWAVHNAHRPIGIATWYVVCNVASANCARELSVVRRCTVAHVCMIYRT